MLQIVWIAQSSPAFDWEDMIKGWTFTEIFSKTVSNYDSWRQNYSLKNSEISFGWRLLYYWGIMQFQWMQTIYSYFFLRKVDDFSDPLTLDPGN